MSPVTIDNPILNSPYREPSRHFRLDAEHQITGTIDAGRRGSSYFLPIATPKKKAAPGLFDEVEESGRAVLRVCRELPDEAVVPVAGNDPRACEACAAVPESLVEVVVASDRRTKKLPPSAKELVWPALCTRIRANVVGTEQGANPASPNTPRSS